jgi:hypothetical protein
MRTRITREDAWLLGLLALRVAFVSPFCAWRKGFHGSYKTRSTPRKDHTSQGPHHTSPARVHAGESCVG